MIGQHTHKHHMKTSSSSQNGARPAPARPRTGYSRFLVLLAVIALPWIVLQHVVARGRGNPRASASTHPVVLNGAIVFRYEPNMTPASDADRILDRAVSLADTAEAATPVHPRRPRFLAHKLDHLAPDRPEAKAGLPTVASVQAGLPTVAAAKAGIYLGGRALSDPVQYERMIKRLHDAGGTALVILVKAGTVYFQTDAPIAQEIHSINPQYELPVVVAVAKKEGLYTIARFVALSDGVLARAKPETRIHTPKSGRALDIGWVDGAAPVTLAYNRELLEDIVTSGIDEVNLDYFRSPTDQDPSAIGLSGKEKADHLEVFLRMARATIDELNPNVKLGISTFAILGWNYPVNFEWLGQDVVRFAPLVDIISPMAYPSMFDPGAYYRPGRDPGSRNYFLVYRTLKGYQELLGPEQSKKLRPWIQGYAMLPAGIAQQIRGVYAAGVCGFTVWNANNNYDRTFEAMKNVQEKPAACT